MDLHCLQSYLCGSVGMKGFTQLNIYIAPDKRDIHKIFFLFLHKNICCGYSLEGPQ